MKRVFSRITAAIFIASGFLAVTILGGCSASPDSAEVSGDIKVLAPMNDANSPSNYSLKLFELTGLSNLQEVSGKFARFFFSPRIINNHLSGTAPKGKFIRNTDGNYIPANDLSQQMVVIYAHMQQLAQLDKELGAEGINKWPRDVGMGVRVRGGMSNNAFYDGKTDSMLLVPYTQDNLPIAVNAGILAHEHFHSLFYKIILKGLDLEASIHNRGMFLKEAGIGEVGVEGRELRVPVGRLESRAETKASSAADNSIHKYYHSALLRGINEGLADFWGWMYTGNPDFIAASLPSEKIARSLEVRDVSAVNSLPSELAVRRSVGIYISYDQENIEKYLTGYAYTLGTQFSRVLKRLSDISAESRSLEDKAARKSIAKLIVQILPLMRTDLEKSNDGSYYNSVQFVQALLSVMPEMNEQECQYLAEVYKNSGEATQAKKTCKQDGSWKLVAE